MHPPVMNMAPSALPVATTPLHREPESEDDHNNGRGHSHSPGHSPGHGHNHSHSQSHSQSHSYSRVGTTVCASTPAPTSTSTPLMVVVPGQARPPPPIKRLLPAATTAPAVRSPGMPRMLAPAPAKGSPPPPPATLAGVLSAAAPRRESAGYSMLSGSVASGKRKREDGGCLAIAPATAMHEPRASGHNLSPAQSYSQSQSQSVSHSQGQGPSVSTSSRAVDDAPTLKVYVGLGKPQPRPHPPQPSSTIAPPVAKRKGSNDFLRKGQWTPTEERLARLLIEAFESGYLPIYTGIRLRGYLAVQLQCDPMRISKKLCAGVIDGKPIPRNYGQKKFRLRKRVGWDRDEATRVLATLQQLMRELWAETGLPLPRHLTLSSTRNAEEDAVEVGRGGAGRGDDGDGEGEEGAEEGGGGGGGRTEPPRPAKRTNHGVVFPIIYLNLSKKGKQQPQQQQLGLPAVGGDSKTEPTGGGARVDGESLQAAYELLNLHHLPRASSPQPPPQPQPEAQLQLQSQPETRPQPQLETPPQPGARPLLLAPSMPSILRQPTPSLATGSVVRAP